MLNRLTLTNFGKHRDLTVDFAPGLTAIKAANEGGKSTLLRAISYALFGSRALPDSLEDTVTWGEPVSSLKVELSFTHAGVEYHIARGKAGAELNYDGGCVTGQTETAKFVADLLGADANLAPKLLIANQGDIRGALGAGAKSASELIEKLADFDQLEQLVEVLQAQLVTGSTTTLKERLQQAEQVLADTLVPDTLDEPALEAELHRAYAQAEKSRVKVQELNKQVREAEQRRDESLRAQAVREALETRLRDRRSALAQMQGEAPDPVEGERPSTHAQEEAVRSAREEWRKLGLASDVAKVNADLAGRWGPFDGENTRAEGGLQAVEQEITACSGQQEALRQRSQAALVEAARLGATILTGSCTACGKDLSDVPEVAQKNTEMQRRKEAQEALAQDCARQESDLQTYKNDLMTRLNAGAPLSQHTAIREGLARLDDTQVPGQLVWVGGEVNPDATQAVEAAEQALVKAREAAAQHDYRVRAYREYRERLARAEASVRECEGQLAAAPEPGDCTALTQAVEDARREYQQALDAQWKLNEQHTLLQRSVHEQVQAHRAALSARETAAKQVASLQGDIASLEFNNALMKAVRDAKPVITTRLWNLVLGAVSSHFSDMRGVPSEVTRSSDGFQVDGRPASTLSGSTKDALGLAIRVALLRTFLPGADFLILDEPNAAMDEERTSAVLGFLAGAGFPQTVIVSHDEMTADVADSIITLQ